MKRRFVPIFILALAGFLCFFHLGQRPLWQDEAETACLADNAMEFGFPRAYDGVNLVSQEEGREFDSSDYLWRWSPWLQIYLAAAGIGVGGRNALAARFPFALAGLVTVFFVYLLVRRRFNDTSWANLSALWLTLCVPYLLFVRQCRYYSVGGLLVILSLYAFRGAWRTRFSHALLPVLALGFLFYANYLLFFSYSISMGLAALLLYRSEILVRRTIAMIAGIGLFVSPGLLLSRIGHQSSLLESALFWENVEVYLGDVFLFMIPLPVILGLLMRWRRSLWPGSRTPLDDEDRFILFLLLIMAGNILILSPAPQRFHRYLVHLYPLAALISGFAMVRAWRWYKPSGLILAVLLLFTNWLYVQPPDWLHMTHRPGTTEIRSLGAANIPLRLLFEEWRSDFADVNQCLIAFVRRECRQGETVLTNYGDLPLQFHTDAKVLGGLQGRIPTPGRPPRLVIVRPLTSLSRAGLLRESDRYIRDNIDLKKDYQEVFIDCPAELYGNRPDPWYHRFFPIHEPYDRVKVYVRKK